MEPGFWAIMFCLLMAVAVILELLSSMGVFAVLALALAGASVVLGFKESAGFGYLTVALNVVLLPFAVWCGLRLVRYSPLMHRRQLLAGTQSAPDAPPLTPLLGREGYALTPLRPAGTVMLGEQRVDVVTDGKFVEPQTRVKVIRVEGNRVLVEPVPVGIKQGTPS